MVELKYEKEVREIYWPGKDGGKKSNGEGDRLIFRTFSFGDHDESWVIVENKYGEETARHNARYLESIVWETDNGG